MAEFSVPIVKSPSTASALKRIPATSRVEALFGFFMANSRKGFVSFASLATRPSRVSATPLKLTLSKSISQPPAPFTPPQPS